MKKSELLQVVKETELVARLRFAPELILLARGVDLEASSNRPNEDIFGISRKDVTVLLQTRAEAANLLEKLLED